jgi:RNA recognition motif-containing protein
MGNRLYVGNLSFQVDSDTIRNAFAEFGDVTDVHLVTDRQTGQLRGFGFVTMGSADAAMRAIAQMNGAVLDGRTLKVNEAQERQNDASRGGFRGGSQSSGSGARRSGNRW